MCSIVNAPPPLVGDARSVGVAAKFGFAFSDNNDVDPWALSRDSTEQVWWKHSNGLYIRASPKRIFEFFSKNM